MFQADRSSALMRPHKSLRTRRLKPCLQKGGGLMVFVGF